MNKPVTKKQGSVGEFTKLVLENTQREIQIKEAADLVAKKGIQSQEAFTESIVNQMGYATAKQNKYNAFVENVKIALTSDFLYGVLENSVTEELREADYSKAIMRSLVNTYINENTVANVLFGMRNRSCFLSESYHVIDKHIKKILENCDKNNCDTFCINAEDRDEFFKELDYEDSESVSDAIKQRVADSVNQFIEDNKRDRDEIKDILTAAKEKIDSITDSNSNDPEAVKESYDHRAKQKVNDVRSKRKNVFHGMISNMCESVMKNDDLKREFMVEGHLNLPKITNRVTLMYTFMEMMNTTKLEKIDEAYIADALESMKM